MNYKKMWITLKWKLNCYQGKIKNESQSCKSDMNPRNFAIKMIDMILEFMEEIEKEG